MIGTAGTEQDVGTVGALFVTLPKAFAEMGAAGRFVGPPLLLGAAGGRPDLGDLSLLEVVVSAAIDGLGWSRLEGGLRDGRRRHRRARDAPSAWSTDVLGLIDSIANNLFLLGGGFALAIFVGWVMRLTHEPGGKPCTLLDANSSEPWAAGWQPPGPPRPDSHPQHRARDRQEPALLLHPLRDKAKRPATPRHCWLPILTMSHRRLSDTTGCRSSGTRSAPGC